MKSKFRKLTLLLLLATIPLSLAADRERVRDLSQKFMCICGCNQLLGGCNHLGCPSSQPMLRELTALVDQGKSDDAIVGHFVDKYGLAVLSAPPASGFNLTAWAMPFVALAVGAIAVVTFVRRFRAKWATAPAADIDLAKYQRKVEEELEKYTPED